ncbi:hypothetical protein V7x_44530 [Crateriforma conspicua]|uniref:Uncharacterized protein n=1 Tax=Crateriforma conspicua TaxID=2527996 RepID=A0A5C6FL22_9PLAN|nr:hypothetical protein V7x_44530 [Crateriforma conspicua]
MGKAGKVDALNQTASGFDGNLCWFPQESGYGCLQRRCMPARQAKQKRSRLKTFDQSLRVECKVNVDGSSPSEVAVILMSPAVSALDRTISMHKPLNAYR